ncbi:cytidine deaminase [Coprococcus sp. OM06-25]|uniref:cytidine deaminase n=1 Tax=Coprococcus sp. OM06-25 TaxID=2293094 RepID=UPI002E8E3625
MAGRENYSDEAECVGGESDNNDKNANGYRVFTGCNIENSSYGATICAERAAVCNAVSSGYKDFKAIAIVGGLNSTGINGITYPCGICRQVLSEFSADMYVIAARSEDDYDMRRLSEFLPASFGAGQME